MSREVANQVKCIKADRSYSIRKGGGQNVATWVPTERMKKGLLEREERRGSKRSKRF